MVHSILDIVIVYVSILNNYENHHVTISIAWYQCVFFLIDLQDEKSGHTNLLHV